MSGILLPLSLLCTALLGVSLYLYRRLLKTRAALLESETRSRTLTDHLAASIIIRDHNGAIIYANPFTEVLTGYSREQIKASPSFLNEIVHDDDREQFNRAQAVCAAGESFQFRFRFFHRSGIEMWAESRTVPILDQDGDVVASLSITLDVTGNVRYQRQVEEKSRDLEEFTYMVTHDLKAPIATMSGMVAILSELQLSGEYAEAHGHLQQALTRLGQLVASVLEYSRVTNQELELQSVSLPEIIDEVLDDFAPLIASSSASIEIDPTLPPVLGDRLRVYQIMSNIVGNALKYRDPTRTLQVRIEQLPSKAPRYHRIAITDNGVGIPPEMHELIFRPFQRATSQEIEGSGIGLACVKKLVTKLGGTISVEDGAPHGSRFILTLRAAPPRNVATLQSTHKNQVQHAPNVQQ